MNILITTGIYPSNENKQLGGYIHEQAKALVCNGYNVCVLVVKSNKQLFNSNRVVEYFLDGVKVIKINYFAIAKTKIPGINIFLFKRKMIKLCRYAKKDFIPDVIYAHMSYESGYVSIKLKEMLGCTLITQEHFSYMLDISNKGTLFRKVLLSTINNSEYFAVVSSYFKANLVQNGINKQKINILYNVINDQYQFYDIKQNDDNKFTFFYAGNLSKSKNVDLLVNAFMCAFSKQDNVLLYIAGLGKQYKKILNIIYENDRIDQIILLGRLTQSEIKEIYIKSNCFVSFSEYETFGLVFREAMMIGRPIITYLNGGIDEDFDDNCGIYVKDLQLNTCVNALVSMYSNYEKYNLRSISEKISKKYSAENFVNEFDNICKMINKLA